MNPSKLEPFIEAQKLRKEQERDIINFTSWLNGVYISRAIAVNFDKNTKYFDAPISFKQKTEKQIYEDNKLKFSAWAAMFNTQFKQKEDTNVHN